MTALAALFAAAALASAPGQSGAQQPETVTDLGDIVVQGRSVERMAETFVDTVAAPARGRGLARWRQGICIGAANLKPEAAQAIVDGVSDIARDLGLTAGPPGCDPTVLIIAATDVNHATRELVASRRGQFHLGGAGTSRGLAALDDFQDTDRPVRWWNVSVPVDADTGQIAVRLPADRVGDGSAAAADGLGPMGYAPVLMRRSASRLSTNIVDITSRVYVILDVDQVQSATLQQLTAYIAMVTLAQVDPDADTSRFATILNLFDDPGQTDGLTEWDRAYLHGLYETQRTRLNAGAHREEIAASIARAHHDIVAARDEKPD